MVMARYARRAPSHRTLVAPQTQRAGITLKSLVETPLGPAWFCWAFRTGRRRCAHSRGTWGLQLVRMMLGAKRYGRAGLIAEAQL